MERTGNITFSVIVPVYNVQAYLSACVKSVVEQAGPADWECILVDRLPFLASLSRIPDSYVG